MGTCPSPAENPSVDLHGPWNRKTNVTSSNYRQWLRGTFHFVFDCLPSLCPYTQWSHHKLCVAAQRHHAHVMPYLSAKLTLASIGNKPFPSLTTRLFCMFGKQLLFRSKTTCACVVLASFCFIHSSRLCLYFKCTLLLHALGPQPFGCYSTYAGWSSIIIRVENLSRWKGCFYFISLCFIVPDNIL